MDLYENSPENLIPIEWSGNMSKELIESFQNSQDRLTIAAKEDLQDLDQFSQKLSDFSIDSIKNVLMAIIESPCSLLGSKYFYIPISLENFYLYCKRTGFVLKNLNIQLVDKYAKFNSDEYKSAIGMK